MGLMSVPVAALNKTDALDPYWNLYNSTLLFPFWLTRDPNSAFAGFIEGESRFRISPLLSRFGNVVSVENGKSSAILSIFLPQDTQWGLGPSTQAHVKWSRN